MKKLIFLVGMPSLYVPRQKLKHPICLSLIALLFLLSACNQNGFTDKREAKNYTDANNLKQGKWIEDIDLTGNITSDSNAPYHRLIVYKDGHPIGIERSYYKDDKLEYEVPYKDGKKSGIQKWYYESGKPWQEVPYVDGQINGTAKEYYESGKTSWETSYVDGKKNGNAIGYYESGKLLQKIPYTDNLVNGTVLGYYENGNLSFETPYTNAKKDGTDKEYYESGSLNTEIPYSNGIMNGDVKTYYPSGKLSQEAPYTNGKLNGMGKWYDENGNLIRIVPYVEGKEDWALFIKRIFCSGTWVGSSMGLQGGIERTSFYTDGSLDTEDPNADGNEVKGTWSSDTIPSDSGTRVGIKVDLHNGEPVYHWNLYMYQIYTNRENVYIEAGFGRQVYSLRLNGN